ncbi:MAG: mandelate racemase [Gammaproteobacteria bacterium]|nr:mandelate racemase [Gammaproteobacteria bacterium]
MGVRLRVREVRFGEREVELRLPFKFGSSVLKRTPQVFVGVCIELEDGRQAWGETAELLVPKWFDKTATRSNSQNLNQLRHSLRQAAQFYCGRGRPLTAFELSAECYQELVVGGASCELPPLAASFGGAELDKAVLDGVCRALGISFQDALRGNAPGIDFSRAAPDLDGFQGARFLAGLAGSSRVAVRHTIGLLDPLTEDQCFQDQSPDDGLPVSLEKVLGVYGPRYFKIKVSGDWEADLQRLTTIAAILDRTKDSYWVTLDGNEQYRDREGLLSLWGGIKAQSHLERFRAGILFIEQPLHRDLAFAIDITPLAAEVPLIIDESDGTMDAFLEARQAGYSGISSKACKGLYKSLVNAARCQGATDRVGRPLFLSAEDLTCQPGLALQQDLALIAGLGIPHVERNAHHYVRGMAGAPEAEQYAFLEAHPDLYHLAAGRACLTIDRGEIALGSLATTGFASGAGIDWSSMGEMKDSTGELS